MCGIYGGTGNKDIVNRTITGLKKLDYRGYDSAGIAFLNSLKPEFRSGSKILSNKITQHKTVGDVLNLKKKLQGCETLKVCCAISHTRWATHGKVCEKNTHPHSSYNGNFSVVHNGIIENYLDIKTFLKLKGIKLLSQTDTEVIPHLLETEYEQLKLDKDGNLPFSYGLAALKKTTDRLIGSYALAILCKSGNILLTKNKSPLFICVKQINPTDTAREVWFASDIAAFETSGNNLFYSLNDGDFAEITNDEIKFYNSNLEDMFLSPLELNKLEEIKNLNNTPGFYMKKEINETEKILENIYNSYKSNENFNSIKKVLKEAKKIELIACGSAYHSCLIGARVFMEEFNIDATAHIASEYIHKPKFIDNNTVCVFVSQSGETADTITCHNICKDLGATTIGIINSKYSTLALKCDYVLPLLAGQEISVASTKAYSAMIYLFRSLAGFKKPPKNLEMNYEQFTPIIELVKKQQFVFFFARGLDYFLANEAALKLRETSYIKAFSMPAGELKHGSIALIDNKTLSFIFCTQHSLVSKVLNAIEQIVARDGKVIIVSDQTELLNLKHKNIAAVYKLPESDSPEIYAGVFLQNLSMDVSLSLGYNPDKPRNLAKAVSVE